MGGQTITFNPRDIKLEELSLIREQNHELRNSQKLLQQDMMNGMQGILAAAQNQFNITSFNPLFQSNIAAPLSVNFTFLNYFYKTHGIIQTAIEQPVLDALSSGDQSGAGVLIKSKLMDEDDMSQLLAFLEDEDIWGVIQNAKIWARLFGGGAIIINDGAKNFSSPLADDGPIPVLKLYAASRWELGSPHKLDDPTAVVDQNTPWEYGAANQEFYNYYGMRLHRSRVIAMNGKEAPWMVRWMLQGWGMSEIERMVEDFNMYIRMNNVIYDLLNEAKVDVFGISGFRETVLQPNGPAKLLQRIQTVQQAKNMNNALLMDKEDLYEQKQMSFAGLAEMKKEVRMAIASACKMPISKIFGVGASGFSSGEDDLENYNSMVQSTIRQPLRKPIRQVIDLVTRHLWGVKIEDYKIAYKPLRVMSAKDEEEIKEKKFNRVTAGYDRALISSKEWGDECHKENLISVETMASAGKLEEFPEAPMGSVPEKGDEEESGKSKSKKEKPE
jgi:phage-related protein (TIGR01555 family)